MSRSAYSSPWVSNLDYCAADEAAFILAYKAIGEAERNTCVPKVQRLKRRLLLHVPTQRLFINRKHFQEEMAISHRETDQMIVRSVELRYQKKWA